MAETEKNSEPLSEINQVSISRGMREDVKIDFAKVADMFVYDQLGNKIRFGDIYKEQKTIIVFSRHLFDFVCQDYLEDLGIIPLEYLQQAKVRLVVIAPSACKLIKSIKRVTDYQHTLYCDPDCELFKAAGCVESMTFGKMKESKHIKSGLIWGILRSTWRVMKEEVKMKPQDVKQQGASFIVGPGDVLHFGHLDQNVTDHVNINELLTEAGVQNVSFPNDQRILAV